MNRKQNIILAALLTLTLSADAQQVRRVKHKEPEHPVQTDSVKANIIDSRQADTLKRPAPPPVPISTPPPSLPTLPPPNPNQ